MVEVIAGSFFMVAIVSTLIFVSAMFVAIGVIASMIAGERDRIVGLIEGSMREVALPRAIAIRTRPARAPARQAVPVHAPWRAAA